MCAKHVKWTAILKEKDMLGTNYTEQGIVNYRSAEEINSAMGLVYAHISLAVIVSMLFTSWE